MLFSNNSEMERLQGAFIDTDEVKSITEFISGRDNATKSVL
jgi:hypothetical protein